MACVYWIHLKEHTDLFSEGYIGFTSKTAKERFYHHLVQSRRNPYKRYKTRECTHLYSSIRKYGSENLIVSTLVIADTNYCLDLENKLRPCKNIGWNIAVGGRRPNIGIKQPKEVIAKRLETMSLKLSDPVEREKHIFNKKKPYIDNPKLAKEQSVKMQSFWRDNPELVRAKSDLMKQRYSDPKYKQKMLDSVPSGAIAAGMKPWNNGTSKQEMWLLAADYYECWISNNKCSPYALSKMFCKKESYFRTLVKKFVNGWIPEDDREYMDWIKEKETNGS